jgi:hypothetical protein
MVTRWTRLKAFVIDHAPSPGLPVQALAEDHVGTYVLPFPCEQSNGVWWNVETREVIHATIIGWRDFRISTRDRPSREARHEHPSVTRTCCQQLCSSLQVS